MSSKHHGIVPKEILDQSKSYFEKQRQDSSVSQPQPSAQELRGKSRQEFKPTPSYSRVFSETVGKKTRPGVNIKLKENPRLNNHADKTAQQDKEKNLDQTTQTPSQETEQETVKPFEPTASFHEVFSGIVGKDKTRHKS